VSRQSCCSPPSGAAGACGAARSSRSSCASAARPRRRRAYRPAHDHAAHAILTRDPSGCTGNAFIDDEVLAEAGTTDHSTYGYQDGSDLQLDVFVDDWGAFAPA
jgi:hypothetical protein